MPELPPTPPDGPDAVPEVPRAVVDRPDPHRRSPWPGGRDPLLDDDQLRLMIDQAHADVRRTESVGPALAMGVLLACLPLLLVLLGLLL